MPRALRQTLALTCVAFVFAGAYALDAATAPALGYVLLLAGAAGLVAVRALPEPDTDGQRPAVAWLTAALIGLLLAAAVGMAAVNAISLRTVVAPFIGVLQIALWLAAGACCVAAGHLWDARRCPAPIARVYERRDWAIAAGLVALGAIARIANLATDPPGLAPDEIGPMSAALDLLHTGQRTAFAIDAQSMTGLFHWTTVFFLKYAAWLGLDNVQTAKLPNALFGALTVGALYLTVRALAPRAVAATAGLFLVWLGWPWILSRLYYLYSGDLLWIGLTTWLAVLGCTSGRLSVLAAAGFAAALGAAWFKTAVLAVPWLALICADFVFLPPPSPVRRRFLPPLFCGFALAVSLAPLLAEVVQQPDFLWRFGQVASLRDRLLADYGLTRTQGYLYGLRGVFTVLQVHEAEVGRHVARLGHPALDLVTSALATVGVLWSLWHVRRSRGARLAVLGFALFLVPAVTSFPADGNPAASRRMVGSAFFVAWLAGIGAGVVAERTVRARRRTAVMLALGGLSIALNVHAVRTSYNTRFYQWHEELGVNLVYLVRALRQAAIAGPVIFHPTYETHLAALGVFDLPNVRQVGTVEDLRAAIRDGCPRMCTVILPWPSPFEANDTPAWIEQLSDLIPPHAWAFGESDPAGVPLYRRAEVRSAAVPPK